MAVNIVLTHYRTRRPKGATRMLKMVHQLHSNASDSLCTCVIVWDTLHTTKIYTQEGIVLCSAADLVDIWIISLQKRLWLITAFCLASCLSLNEMQMALVLLLGVCVCVCVCVWLWFVGLLFRQFSV